MGRRVRETLVRLSGAQRGPDTKRYIRTLSVISRGPFLLSHRLTPKHTPQPHRGLGRGVLLGIDRGPKSARAVL